jgi:hypothetical protein
MMSAVFAVMAAAQSPVAMRVEVDAVEPVETGIRMEVRVQVSPEDRGRIGDNAMVRIELDGDVPPGQSPLWAIRLDDVGSAVIDTVWPPGEHDLKVTIESPGRQHVGLWVGTVRVPGAEAVTGPETASGAVRVASEEQVPAGEAPPTEDSAVDEAAAALEVEAPVVAASATAAAVQVPGEGRAAVEPTTDAPEELFEPQVPAVESAAIAAAEQVPVEAQSEPGPTVDGAEASPEDAAPVVEAAAPASAEQMPAEAIPEAKVAAVADEAPAGRRDLEPDEPEDESLSDAETQMAAAAAAVAESTGTSQRAGPGAEVPGAPETSGQPLAEPLRAGSEAEDAEPMTDAAVVAPTEAPVTANALEAIALWGTAAAGTRELTLVATRGRQPADGLSTTELRLTVGRDQVPIRAAGGRHQAPLLLGVAVDLSPQGAVQWSQVRRGLEPLLERARAGFGRSFAATHGKIGEWMEGADEAVAALEPGAGGGLPELIADAMRRFDEQRGRAFLLVVTDGRGSVPRSAWDEAEAAVAGAGVPVLVVSLWDRDFDQRARRQLSRLGEISGGRSFLVQGAEQLDGAVDRFGPVLDGGIALRFPSDALLGSPQPVQVTSTDPAVEITAPASIR